MHNTIYKHFWYYMCLICTIVSISDRTVTVTNLLQLVFLFERLYFIMKHRPNQLHALCNKESFVVVINTTCQNSG